VLWELEPGAHVIERAGLPTLSALDDPSKLEAFIATNADERPLGAGDGARAAPAGALRQVRGVIRIGAAPSEWTIWKPARTRAAIPTP
jgi:hypothetical protein